MTAKEFFKMICIRFIMGIS